MCTVTYFPTNKGYILTSSRDEAVARKTLPIREYLIGDNHLYFPKDELAGGTWIVSDKKNKAACLLNGAFEKHTRKLNYRKSRGLIVLDGFSYPSFQEFADSIDLFEVEPFTLLLLEKENELVFIQLIWDGEQKHIERIETSKPNIWSSSTLYSKEVRDLRRGWFKSLVESHQVEASELLDFHLTKHSDNLQENILMTRGDKLKTVSVTQILFEEEVSMSYLDLMKEIMPISV